MMGMLKLAGLAVIMTGFAFGIGYFWGRDNGFKAGYALKTAEVKTATDRVNTDNKDREQETADAIHRDQERTENVRVINSEQDGMKCTVTAKYAARYPL